MTKAEGVVTEALATEMELILALASSLTKQSNPVGDARQMIADTARIVLAALSDAGFAVVELPNPKEFALGEREWDFASVDSEGFVNYQATKNRIEFSLAHDDGTAAELGGLPTCAEGSVPAELLQDFAAALLAAHSKATS